MQMELNSYEIEREKRIQANSNKLAELIDRSKADFACLRAPKVIKKKRRSTSNLIVEKSDRVLRKQKEELDYKEDKEDCYTTEEVKVELMAKIEERILVHKSNPNVPKAYRKYEDDTVSLLVDELGLESQCPLTKRALKILDGGTALDPDSKVEAKIGIKQLLFKDMDRLKGTLVGRGWTEMQFGELIDFRARFGRTMYVMQ